MPLQTLLDLGHLLQMAALALSIFNLVAFLWLTFTVWLNGDRHAGIVRLGVLGLGLSALFFFIHALLISSPLTTSSSLFSLDFWWHMIWIPALGVPYIWFAIGLYYAAVINSHWRRRRSFLLILSGILGLSVLTLLILNSNTFTYTNVLRLLSYSDGIDDMGHGLYSPLVLIPILFLIYVTFCAIGPWFTTRRISRLLKILWRTLSGRSTGRRWLLHRELMDAFWDDPIDVELPNEPELSWYLARPGLLLAALLMVSLTTTLGVLFVRSMINWLGYGTPLPSLTPPQSIFPSGSPVPFNLLLLDMLATGGVAIVILLIGYSVVRHGVLIERPLARRGFFEQWRGIVIVATLVALLIAWLIAMTHSSLGGLLLITSLATGAYALFTWSSYTAHDRYISMLGPFVRSTGQRHWLNTDLYKTEQDLEYLFFHLCHDVLIVQFAYLSILTGNVRRSFSYNWPTELAPNTWMHSGNTGEIAAYREAPGRKLDADAHVKPARRVRVLVNEQPAIVWILPIYNERGLVANLYLGPREDGGAFTAEDMDLAQACGQRILDTLGDHEAMQAVANLLRRQVIDVKLLGAQQRRVLHDEILPQMHLALLQLEMLRSMSPPESAAEQSLSSQETHKQIVDEAINMISATHRRLAAMMRATAPGAPHRLERDGLINAIQSMLEQDFQNAFDEITWDISEETAISIDECISPAIAELVLAAVQEALRNAARHARGSDVHRHLHLTLQATWDPTAQCFELIVADNGVGIVSAASPTTGTGGGLLTHSALLAIAGGSLTITSAPGEGVTIKIILPAEVFA